MLPVQRELDDGKGWKISDPWAFDLWTEGTGEGIRIKWDSNYGWFEIYTIQNDPNNENESLEDYQGHLEPTVFINNLNMIKALVDQMEPRLAELSKQKAAEETIHE